MSKVDNLLDRYEQNVNRPWKKRLDGAQKVWFVVYPPKYEREIRARIGEFRMVTAQSSHGWLEYDVTTSFPKWMSKHEYRERHFEDPSGFDYIKQDFREDLSGEIRSDLKSQGEDAVMALTGVGALFGIIYVSNLIEEVQSDIQGRLVVFFPGRHENNVYRLLDARDGWDYLALPIKA